MCSDQSSPGSWGCEEEEHILSCRSQPARKLLCARVLWGDVMQELVMTSEKYKRYTQKLFKQKAKLISDSDHDTWGNQSETECRKLEQNCTPLPFYSVIQCFMEVLIWRDKPIEMNHVHYLIKLEITVTVWLIALCGNISSIIKPADFELAMTHFALSILLVQTIAMQLYVVVKVVHWLFQNTYLRSVLYNYSTAYTTKKNCCVVLCFSPLCPHAEAKGTLTVSEVLLGLECELELWRELWLWGFSCGEKLVPATKHKKRERHHQ